MGQEFAAEYQLLKSDLGGRSKYSFDNLVQQSGIGIESSVDGNIYKLGFIFRKIYENPAENSYGDGGERAQKWYQLIGGQVSNVQKRPL